MVCFELIRISETKGLATIITIGTTLQKSNNRETLCRKFETANKIDLADIDKVKSIFAKTLKSKAKPGYWYHDEKGNWMQKK